MKRNTLNLFLIIAASFMAGALAPSVMMRSEAASQPASNPKVLLVDYMNVEPAKANEYLNMERELWKPMHQLRVQSGKLKSWSVYEVKSPLFSPVGEQKNYNYLTVAEYDSVEDAKAPWNLDDFRKALPGKDMNVVGERTQSARERVGSDMLVLVEQVK